MPITEDEWKIVEARLQYDIDNNIGGDVALAFIGKQNIDKRLHEEIEDKRRHNSKKE